MRLTIVTTMTAAALMSTTCNATGDAMKTDSATDGNIDTNLPGIPPIDAAAPDDVEMTVFGLD